MSETQGGYEDFFNAQEEVNELFFRTLEGVLSGKGITVPQAFTLKALKEQGGLCRMSDLAATRFQSPAAMTGIVDRLIHMELVERRSDPNDRRVILLTLTARGTALVASVEKRIRGMMGRFFEGISGKDRESMMRIFTRLKAFFKEEIDAQKKT